MIQICYDIRNYYLNSIVIKWVGQSTNLLNNPYIIGVVAIFSSPEPKPRDELL